MIIFGFTIWQILGVLSIVLLFLFWSSRNSIWGGMTGGGLIGIIAALFKHGSFDWYYAAKFAITGVMIGLLFDLWSFIINKIRP